MEKQGVRRIRCRRNKEWKKKSREELGVGGTKSKRGVRGARIGRNKVWEENRMGELRSVRNNEREEH